MWLGWVCRRMAPLAIVLISGIVVLMVLLQWGILCTNFHTLKYINNLCVEYLSGEISGNLCHPLCITSDIELLSCHPTIQQEGTKFSARWNGKEILLKTLHKTSLHEFELLHWTDLNNNKIYPTEEEFLTIIKRLILTKTNISISENEAKAISNLSSLGMNEDIKRTIIMDNIWLMLQDNDFLNTILFEKRNIFPKYVGSCGPLYAIEYAELVKGSSALFSLEDTEEEWERKLQIAISIFELLDKLDEVKLQICDVQLKEFGLLGSHMKYLSPGSVRSRGNLPLKKSCKHDHDCDFFDCKAKCNSTTGRCTKSIESDNLQIVCEKIYLGWTAAGRVILPGLLVSTKASSTLASLLRQCADPNSVHHPISLRRALYNNLLRRN